MKIAFCLVLESQFQQGCQARERSRNNFFAGEDSICRHSSDLIEFRHRRDDDLAPQDYGVTNVLALLESLKSEIDRYYSTTEGQRLTSCEFFEQLKSNFPNKSQIPAETTISSVGGHFGGREAQ